MESLVLKKKKWAIEQLDRLDTAEKRFIELEDRKWNVQNEEQRDITMEYIEKRIKVMKINEKNLASVGAVATLIIMVVVIIIG